MWFALPLRLQINPKRRLLRAWNLVDVPGRAVANRIGWCDRDQRNANVSWLKLYPDWSQNISSIVWIIIIQVGIRSIMSQLQLIHSLCNGVFRDDQLTILQAQKILSTSSGVPWGAPLERQSGLSILQLLPSNFVPYIQATCDRSLSEFIRGRVSEVPRSLVINGYQT